jgi:hypothetical protein
LSTRSVCKQFNAVTIILCMSVHRSALLYICRIALALARQMRIRILTRKFAKSFTCSNGWISTASVLSRVPVGHSVACQDQDKTGVVVASQLWSCSQRTALASISFFVVGSLHVQLVRIVRRKAISTTARAISKALFLTYFGLLLRYR